LQTHLNRSQLSASALMWTLLQIVLEPTLSLSYTKTIRETKSNFLTTRKSASSQLIILICEIRSDMILLQQVGEHYWGRMTKQESLKLWMPQGCSSTTQKSNMEK